MFISLSRDIKKEEAWKEKYIEILNYILLGKRVSQRFPNDEEFENALITKEIYRLQAKNRNFLLESMENHKSAYPIVIDDLTVEHIMPQKLTKEWKQRLGENWQDIHNKYLHSLGNLSLTAKNTELSNKTLEDKQQIDYQTSRLKLNFKLSGITEWNEEAIINRAKDLIKTAKKIWPFPESSYLKPVIEEQIFDLTNEDNFSRSKPSYLFIENDENGIQLKTWRDLLMNVCKYLHDFSPTQFSEIQNSPEFKWNFDINKPLRVPLQFSKNKFVEGNISANGIISFLQKICDRLNYSAENISFSIKHLNE